MADGASTVGELIEAAATALAQRKPKETKPSTALDAELSRLVSIYGASVVRDAAARATKGKIGRKQEQDWPLLRQVFSQDAQDWLDGKDPFKIRSNYAVATAFAKAHPGHNAAATQRRIMGKLAKKRRYLFHISAWQISERERPFSVYFHAAAELIAIAEDRLGKMIQDDVDRHFGKLQRYRELIGEPSAQLSVMQIESDLDAAILSRSALVPSDPANLLQGLAGFRS